MDRQTARNYVALKVEDPQQTKFSATTYNNAIELAQEQFCIDAKAILQESTLTAVADQSYIALPTDFLVCVLVRHRGLKLGPTNRYALSFQSGTDWTTLPSGTPSSFYIDEQNSRLVMVPAPTSAEAGAVVTINYVAIPTALSADSSTLLAGNTILSYYAPAVVNWAASEVLTYAPLDQSKIIKRSLCLKDYERYVDQCIMVYKNMADEPLQMRGGRTWQDQKQGNVPSAFTS